MLFLASILDLPVHGKTGEAIGKLEDLIVRIGDEPYPPIAGLVVRDGRRQFFVPGGHLQALNGVARLSSSTVDLQPFVRRDGEVLLRKDVLDHQIIDITGRRIVRVNDVQLAGDRQHLPAGRRRCQPAGAAAPAGAARAVRPDRRPADHRLERGAVPGQRRAGAAEGLV